jgi:cation diffusion facilitator CzcD-associated flavoprotein CzcO
LNCFSLSAGSHDNQLVYDVAVVGAGLFGSAVAKYVAKVSTNKGYQMLCLFLALAFE